MEPEKQYTLDELKAKLTEKDFAFKKHFYNSVDKKLIQAYQDAFKQSVFSYIEQDGLFLLYSNTVHKISDIISKTYKIKYSKVCMFAHCLSDNIDLLNGKIMTDSDDNLYFIESKECIKIGRSNNIKIRLGTLQTDNGSPLKVLFVKNGSGNYEYAIHRLFDYLRVRGEWFKKHPDIYNYIDILKQYDNPENESFGKSYKSSVKLMNDIKNVRRT